MPTASLVAGLVLLLAGSASAQPAPDTTGAGQAAVRLVEAARARDYAGLVAFIDPRTVADITARFPATPDASDADLRDMLTAEGLDADSVVAAVRAADPDASPGPDKDLVTLVRLSDWMHALLAAGPIDVPALLARLLAHSAACDHDSPVTLFDDVGYVPVRTDAGEDGAVEVVGRLSATQEGETREALMATPLRWQGARWTVADVPFSAAGMEPNPLTEILGTDADLLFYALVAFGASDAPAACAAE